MTREGAPRRILVTGAAGFIGGAVCALLRGQGRSVAGLGRRAPAKGRNPCGEFIVCDMTESAEAVSAALERAAPEAVVHLAAPVPSHAGAAGWSLIEPTARAAENLFTACAAMERPPKIVLGSSGAVYGGCPVGAAISERRAPAPPTHYGVAKTLVEMLAVRAAQSAGLTIACVRPFNVFGPGQKADRVVPSFTRQIVRIAEKGGGEIRVGNLDSHRDFVDVRDVAAAFALMIDKGRGGSVYNVCSGRATKIRKVLDTLISLAGLKGEVRVIGERLSAEHVPYQRGNPGKIQRMGWRARHSFRRTMADVFEEWRAEGRAK
ncbi:MAG: NAD-dependent epimerase/dehydratase family protein [bacterium]